MKILFFLLFCLSVFGSDSFELSNPLLNTTWEECQKEFSVKNKWKYRNIKSSYDLPLEKDFLQALKNHEISKKYRDLKGIKIHIKELYKNDLSGWYIQSRFLQKILKVVFPKAKFTENMGDSNLTFILDDPQRAERPFRVDINMFKIINQSGKSISKYGLRALFGLNSEHKVFHLYQYYNPNIYFINSIKNPDLNPLPATFLELALKNGDFDVFISSRSNEGFEMISDLFDEKYNLSDIIYHNLEIPNGKKVFIYNDLLGIMPYLLKMSNLVLVAGRTNQFESVGLEIPTIVFANDSIIHDWKSHTDALFSILLSYKNVEIFENIKDLENNKSVFQAGIDNKHMAKPEISMTDYVLNKLMQKIDQQLSK